MVLAAVALALAAAWTATLGGLAPLAYALVGFAFAPVFPTALAWLQEVFPQRAEQIAPLVFAVANLGPVLTAPAIGWGVSLAGTGTIPPALGSLVLALLLVVGLLWRSDRGAARAGIDRGAGQGVR
jgi:predicted MFS family arabinose efflux permease